jgi:hypothetical protein
MPSSTDTPLLDAIRRALSTDDPTSLELRDAVFEFVRRRKANAEAPQDVIIALKLHVQRAGPADSPEEESALTERIVKWGIDAYYR